ncbi:hypothetical protein SynBIOSE41_02390 [Synechococcus sp. BIOS-E4-1]|nr:hypothetical protein SynBIOSE41_02390 [Synechococcus sp. BIOS-E4-1]
MSYRQYRSVGAKAILVLEGKRLDSKIMEVKIAEKIKELPLP